MIPTTKHHLWNTVALPLLALTLLSALDPRHHAGVACPSPPACTTCNAQSAVCSICPDDPAMPDTLTELTVLPNGCGTFKFQGLLPSDLFSKYAKLEKLIMDNVNVIRLRTAPFSHCAQLRVLSMAQNHIRGVIDLYWQGLVNLEELNLMQNAIRMLKEDCFRPLKKAKILNLSDNDIGNLNGKEFTGLGNLEKLDLSRNPITSVHADSFRMLTSIVEIRMDEVNLSQIPAKIFSGLSTFRRLSIAKSQVASLADDSLAGTSLDSLDLSHNQLTSAPTTALRQAARPPKTVDLSHNQISAVRPGQLGGLVLDKIDLSANPLTRLEFGAFSGSRIGQLDLSSTELHTLPDSMEATLQAGSTTLNLDQVTSWQCDCGSLWLGRFLQASASSQSPSCGPGGKYGGQRLKAATPQLEIDCVTTTTTTTTTSTTTTTPTSTTTTTTTAPTPGLNTETKRNLPAVPSNQSPSSAASTSHTRPASNPGIDHAKSPSSSSLSTVSPSSKPSTKEDPTVRLILPALIALCCLALILSTVGILIGCVLCRKQRHIGTDPEKSESPLHRRASTICSSGQPPVKMAWNTTKRSSQI